MSAAPLAPAAADSPQRVPISTILGFVAMGFGMFMAILDIQIVSSSISEIQAGLSASSSEISWVQTSYLVAEVIMIPLSGYLSRMLSTRVFFCTATAIFTLMSFLCATADSLDEMIVFRALQGFFSGALIPTVFASGYQIFGRNRSTTISVILGLTATLAPTIGPTLGGYLTELFSWHWLFLINIIPGIVVTTAVWNLVDIDKPDPKLFENIDFAGFAFMATFLGSAEYVLEEGAHNDWWADGTIRTFTGLAIVGGILFFWRALTHPNPIVDLRVYRNRNFAVGSTFAFVVGIGLYGIVYLLPLYLARVRGMNALQIGEIMFVTGLFQFLASPIAGVMSRQGDPRAVIAVGFSFLLISCVQFTGLTSEWGFWEMLVPQALRGAGLMLCMVPINAVALGTLPLDLLKSASGIFNLSRNLGGAFGLAMLNTLLIDRTNLHWQRLGEATGAGRPETQNFLENMAARYEFLHFGDGQAAAAKILGQLVMREASVLAFTDLFFVLACIFGAAIVALPLARKPNMAQPVAMEE